MDMEALMAMQLNIAVDVRNTFKETLMNHLRLYTDHPYTVSDEKAIASNNNRLERVLMRLKEAFFSTLVSTKTFAGHVGPHEQPKRTSN